MAIASALVLGSVPVAATAAEPSETVVLPGPTVAALTADIDDDGAREIVRVRTAAEAVLIEAWDLRDEQWISVWSADARELAAVGATAVDTAGPPAIIRSRVDGRDRVLLVAAGFDSQTGMPNCCLTVHELIVTGDRFELRPMPTPGGPAEFVAAIDLDADGTDELVTTTTAWPTESSEDATTRFEVLRRTSGWETMAAWDEELPWYGLTIAETDGTPGSEFLTTGESGEVLRIAWIDGALAMDRASLGRDANGGAWVVGALDGALIVSEPEAVSLMEWPRDGAPSVVATHRAVGYPSIGIAGVGRDGLILVHDGVELRSSAPATTVLDARLEPLGEVELRPDAAVLWELVEEMSRTGGWGIERNIWPYFGAVPGGWAAGVPAYIVGGMLVTPGSPGSFETRPIATLVGQPIGPAGPGDGWIAMADTYIATDTISYLHAGPIFGAGQMVIAPAERLLDPELMGAAGEVRLERGLELGHEDGVTSVLAAPDGLSLVVSAPPGTVAVSWDGISLQDHGGIDGTLRLEVPPPRRQQPDRATSFDRALILIGPTGNAFVHRWSGTFAPEAPELIAWTEAEALSLQATVAGRTSPGSTVTIDGRTAQVNQFGAYRATVDAPIWPRDVVVVARDPFGGQAVAMVQVIGLVDYRGLPWVPIAGGLTVVAGVALFLRTPRHRPTTERFAADDGLLEELDGDAL